MIEMIEVAKTGLSWILLASGAFFFVVSALGLVRMPDVFTRMHAGSIGDTAGAGLMLAGMMVAAGVGLVSVKLIVILVIILFTSPIASHALAQAALHAGIEPLLASKGRRKSTDPKKSTRRKPASKTGRRAPSRKAGETSR
jgi:multicomponent Na+:H+ antiporter subunit G